MIWVVDAAGVSEDLALHPVPYAGSRAQCEPQRFEQVYRWKGSSQSAWPPVACGTDYQHEAILQSTIDQIGISLMPFPPKERAALLQLKGVGPTVITRLEQMGIASLAELSRADVTDILARASAALGSTCWRNSPQARAAITAAVDFAKDALSR